MSMVQLRRITWRFLLPAPPMGQWQHLVVVGADAEMLRALASTDLAADVSTLPSVDRPADCIVVLRTSHKPLSNIRFLEPGGILLVESDRRRRGGRWTGPRRTARRGAEQELSWLGTWMVAPTIDNPRRFVPLDDRGAFDWYLRSLFIPGSALSLAASAGTRALLRTAGVRAVAALAPAYYTLFQRPPGNAVPIGPLPIALEALPAGTEPRPAPDAVRCLVLTSGQDAASRAVVLPFPEGARMPIAAIKVANDPAFNPDTEAEYHRLRELRAALPTELARAVPRPVGLGQLGELAVATQSSAPGVVMERVAGRLFTSERRRIEALQTPAHWVTEFHHATRSGTIEWDDDLGRRIMLEPLAEILEPRSHLVDVDRVIAVVRQRSERLRGTRLPLVGQHFDLAPCNVFLDGRDLTVLDWELSYSRLHEEVGLPLRDLLFLTTYWYFLVRRARSVDHEVRLVPELIGAGPGRLLEAAHDVIARYCDRLAIDPAAVPLLYTSLWIERAQYQRRRNAAIGLPASSVLATVDTCVRYLGAIS